MNTDKNKEKKRAGLLTPVFFFLGLSAFICVNLWPFSLAAEPPPGKLLIAFASYRDRPNHSNVYFYEHDGIASGKIVGTVAGAPQRSRC